MSNEYLIYIWDLAVEKNVPCSVIEDLIDNKLLYATPDKRWIHRSSVEALDRFLQAVKEFTDVQEK